MLAPTGAEAGGNWVAAMVSGGPVRHPKSGGGWVWVTWPNRGAGQCVSYGMPVAIPWDPPLHPKGSPVAPPWDPPLHPEGPPLHPRGIPHCTPRDPHAPPWDPHCTPKGSPMHPHRTPIAPLSTPGCPPLPVDSPSRVCFVASGFPGWGPQSGCPPSNAPLPPPSTQPFTQTCKDLHRGSLCKERGTGVPHHHPTPRTQ